MPTTIPTEEELRLRRVAELILKSFTPAMIGEAMGLTSRPAMYELYYRALRYMDEEYSRELWEYRLIQYAKDEYKLRRLYLAAFPNLKPGETIPQIDHQALLSILRIEEHQARIMGLNAPIKHHVDHAHQSAQVEILIRAITHVIPDEAIPRVYAALEEVAQSISFPLPGGGQNGSDLSQRPRGGLVSPTPDPRTDDGSDPD